MTDLLLKSSGPVADQYCSLGTRSAVQIGGSRLLSGGGRCPSACTRAVAPPRPVTEAPNSRGGLITNTVPVGDHRHLIAQVPRQSNGLTSFCVIAFMIVLRQATELTVQLLVRRCRLNALDGTVNWFTCGISNQTFCDGHHSPGLPPKPFWGECCRGCLTSAVDGMVHPNRSTIMPKKNDVTDQRELTAQELEVVTGGFFFPL